MTDLDFFRFKRELKNPLSADQKRAFRRKFRKNVIRFYKQIKAGEAKRLPALEALKAYQDYKKAKRREYLELKKLVDAEVNTREKAAIEAETSNMDMSKISAEPEAEDTNECVDAHTEMNNFIQKQKDKRMREVQRANRAKGINGNSSQFGDNERLIGQTHNRIPTEIVMDKPPQMPLNGVHMNKVQKQMNEFL